MARPLPVKARVFVSGDDGQKIFNSLDGGDCLIRVPLQVRSLPIDFPDPLCFYVSRLRIRPDHFLFWIFPIWSHFAQLDALIVNGVSEIKLGSDVRRRSFIFEKDSENIFDVFSLNVVEGHGENRKCLTSKLPGRQHSPRSGNLLLPVRAERRVEHHRCLHDCP